MYFCTKQHAHEHMGNHRTGRHRIAFIYWIWLVVVQIDGITQEARKI